jgi:hypothetical protein
LAKLAYGFDVLWTNRSNVNWKLLRMGTTVCSMHTFSDADYSAFIVSNKDKRTQLRSYSEIIPSPQNKIFTHTHEQKGD